MSDTKWLDELLVAFYPEQIIVWLRESNPLLDGDSPAERLAVGDFQAVSELAHQLVTEVKS